MAEQYLGIDIHDEYAALTLVAKTWRGVDIVQSSWFRLSPEHKDEATQDLFVQEVSDFLNAGTAKPREVFLSLPRHHCTVQSFEVPATDAQTLDPMIQMEMERHFAFPLDSMSVTYHGMPASSHQHHVIAVATKKERVEMYLNWLAQAGLKSDGINLPLASQMNLLDQNGTLHENLQAIVDINSTRVDVSLVKGKILVSSRSVPIPIKNFDQIFFQSDFSHSPTDPVIEEFSKFLTEILESILSGSKSLDNEETIARINVFGGGHAMEDLVSALQTQSGVSTEAALPVFLKKDAPLDFSPAFQMTSLGLCLQPTLQDPIELKLHSQSAHKTKTKSGWKSTVVLSVMTLAVLAGLVMGQIQKNQDTLDSLNRQLEEIKPQTVRLQVIDQEFAQLSDYTEALNAIEHRSPLKLPLLQELSRTLPKDTWVTRISIKQNQIEIQGYSASASRLIPLLEKSDFLKDTQFKGSVTTQALGKRFTIQSTMEPGK